MNLSTGTSRGPDALPALASRRLRLGDVTAVPDHGGVLVACWPDADAMTARVLALGGLASPVVRMAGGALIGDLSLQDNLMLEPALDDGLLPSGLLPEIDALFSHAGRPVDWPGWATVMPTQATPLALMQVRVGRAIVADADILLVDAGEWDDALLPPLQFSRSFSAQYPWRLLAWATHDAARATRLRASLQEFLS